ncbi:MAG: MFS transporter [Actinomycetota bacterium]
MRTTGRTGRNARILFALGGVSTGIFIPFFVLWLRDRGLAPDQIGFVVAASEAASLLAGPFWSHFADTRVGARRTLVVSSLASGVTALVLLGAGTSPWLIFAAVILLGAAQAPGTPLSDALALGTLPERETEYGTIRLWASAGWAVATIGLGAFFQHQGLDSMLPLYAVSTVAFALVAARFPQDVPVDREPSSSRLGTVGETFRATPRLGLFLLGVSLATAATQAAWTFVPLVIAGGGGGPLLVGVSAGLAAIVEIPVFAAGGAIGKRFSQRTIYVVGIAMYTATMLAWAATQDPEIVAILRAASGVAFALVYPSLVVITGRIVPRELRNTGQVLLGTSRDLAPIIGSAVGGIVYTQLGAPALFLGAAIFAAAGAVVVWISLER